jgi:hypothetical protein
VFQAYERDRLRATWGYNGFTTSTDFQYLEDVASRMDSFSDYISSTGTLMVATSSLTIDLANKLRIADDNKELVVIFSPVELLLKDSMGRITGISDGVAKEEIPDSAYNANTKAVAIFFPNDSYEYILKGTGDGTYGLLAEHPDNGGKLRVYGPAVPVKIGEVHHYKINWDLVREKKNGVIIQIDNEGDGLVDREILTDSLLTAVTQYLAEEPSIAPARSSSLEDTQLLCADGIDNDRDGAKDYADGDCEEFTPPRTIQVYIPTPSTYPVFINSTSTN